MKWKSPEKRQERINDLYIKLSRLNAYERYHRKNNHFNEWRQINNELKHTVRAISWHEKKLGIAL